MSTTNIETKSKADGGEIWIPKTTPANSPHILTRQEHRNIVIVSIFLVSLLFAILITFFITANSNHVTTEENVVTVTSYKLSFYATIVFFITVIVPIIATFTLLALNVMNDIPLRLTWQALKKRTQFIDASYYIGIIAFLTTMLGLGVCAISTEMMPFSKSYDYTDPSTGKTVQLQAYPYWEISTKDRDTATLIDPKTGKVDETQQLPVKISDLNVTPFTSTYTITHEPLENMQTVPLEKELDFTEVEPNPGEKVKIFEDGTYEIIEAK